METKRQRGDALMHPRVLQGSIKIHGDGDAASVPARLNP
jgi:hypothetical protein